MAMTFKPRKQQIHVPGFGVVQKEDFTQEHFEVLIKRASDRDAFIKQYFEVTSFGDLPLFEKTEAEKKAKEDAAKAEEKAARKAEADARKEANERARKAATEEKELRAKKDAEEKALKDQQAIKDQEEAALLAEMEKEEAEKKALDNWQAQ
jgi:hypothetical protein